MKIYSFFFFLIMLTISCKHKTNFNEFPEVSYSKNIAPIIVSNCTQSNCHGSEKHKKFELLSYDQVIKNTGVVFGSPEKSNLYNIINTYNSNDLMPPKPNSKLSDSQIEQIYLWIGQGAKNN